MTNSVSFDRAADFYDETRTLPPEVARACRGTILAATDAGASTRFLELGIGTGRIAAPFIEAGDHLVGVDLSRRMMAALRVRFPAASLVQADITALPFACASFDVAIAVHVFHLVGEWERALVEARRVLRPGGALVWSWHRRMPNSLNRRLRQKLAELAQARGFSTCRPGAGGPTDIERALARLGATQSEFEVARWQRRRTSLREELAALHARQTSDTWPLPDEVLAALLAELQRWALAEYGSLEYAEPLAERMSVHIARF
ncbi:MAG: class I SAM-dependent methyltransferase [Ardenticatenaceae bacterium]|nr:class I SAM-dependent methyltransferase [Ardenticatenaceae bacterium]